VQAPALKRCAAHIPYNRQNPCARIGASERIEGAIGTQICVLNRILGVLRLAHQPSCKIVGVIQMRQDKHLEMLGPIRVVGEQNLAPICIRVTHAMTSVIAGNRRCAGGKSRRRSGIMMRFGAVGRISFIGRCLGLRPNYADEPDTVALQTA